MKSIEEEDDEIKENADDHDQFSLITQDSNIQELA